MSELTSLESIKATLTGGSLSVSKWQPFKACARAERATATGALEADEHTLSARKRLIDIGHPAWQRIGKICTQLRDWWEYETFPYTVKGIRLLKRDRREQIIEQVAQFATELERAAQLLEAARYEVLDLAERQLGRMFDRALYPETFVGQFKCEFRERSIEPPSYLMTTNAEEYKRELARSIEDIRRSMANFEQQTWQKLSELTGRLMANLDGGRIMGSNLDNFSKLFDRVASLNFEGTAVFRSAMGEVKEILDGVSAEDLRRSKGLRQEVKEEMKDFIGRFAELGKTVTEVNQEEPEGIDSPARARVGQLIAGLISA